MIYCVAGSAACAPDDLARFQNLFKNYEITYVAVNEQITRFPDRPAFGATVHPEDAHRFVRDGVPIFSTRAAPGVDFVYDERPYRNGTSGLYAVGWILRSRPTALVYLAGVPIDDTPHFYDDKGLGDSLSSYQHFWQEALPRLRGKVFSMSGWTRELLGDPPDNK